MFFAFLHKMRAGCHDKCGVRQGTPTVHNRPAAPNTAAVCGAVHRAHGRRHQEGSDIRPLPSWWIYGKEERNIRRTPARFPAGRRYSQMLPGFGQYRGGAGGAEPYSLRVPGPDTGPGRRPPARRSAARPRSH